MDHPLFGFGILTFLHHIAGWDNFITHENLIQSLQHTIRGKQERFFVLKYSFILEYIFVAE